MLSPLGAAAPPALANGAPMPPLRARPEALDPDGWRLLLMHWAERQFWPSTAAALAGGVPDSVQGQLWYRAFTGRVAGGAAAAAAAAEFAEMGRRAAEMKERLDFDWNGAHRSAAGEQPFRQLFRQ